MTTATADYGTIAEAGTVRFERLLPGPIERVWAYLTESDKRAKWLAHGDMDLKPGGEMEYVWRNWELAQPDEVAPEKWSGEHRMKGHIVRVEPPRLLVHTWDEESSSAEVSFELSEEGDKVRLVLTNRRLPNRGEVVGVSGGWHTHLDVLQEVLEGGPRSRFWDKVERLEKEYEVRTPA
ncbi:SRPBCC family protein [Sphingosinicella sp. LHD-64]|uniref:SRPBCC family protein n=1 Tax=Sphingosinicella sp. LHD-64 TaxID=3072139 RepID=UPI00280F5242|nr:SRPBCC family protein [Sphingosinicella sp. LHD-64]MDQ8755968.1 SRPBCC family protein [Sphingosinicella sp. LHD-64]